MNDLEESTRWTEELDNGVTSQSLMEMSLCKVLGPCMALLWAPQMVWTPCFFTFTVHHGLCAFQGPCTHPKTHFLSHLRKHTFMGGNGSDFMWTQFIF